MNDRETFIALYTSAYTAIVMSGVPAQAIQRQFELIMETLRKSRCKTVTPEQAVKIVDEIDTECMFADIVLHEVMKGSIQPGEDR